MSGEPQTAAGRALLAWWDARDEADPDPTWRTGKIAAIEAEAVAARDRELRAALRDLNRHSGKGHGPCVPFVAVLALLADPEP